MAFEDKNQKNTEELLTQDRESYAAIRAQNARIRKKLAIVLIGLLATLALLLGIVFLMNQLKADNGKYTPPEIEFSPTYQGDIFAYEKYLAKNPDVVLYSPDASGNIRFTVEENAELDRTVYFLCDFLDAMKLGDASLYNSFFNEIYFKNHQKQQSFSPQMIYDAVIIFVGSSKDSNGDMIYSYRLEYRILQNDGSLRRDVGSNAIVPQYVTLRVDETDTTVSIETLYSQITIMGN